MARGGEQFAAYAEERMRQEVLRAYNRLNVAPGSAEGIWGSGFDCGIDVAIMTLRAEEKHEAADALEKLRPR